MDQEDVRGIGRERVTVVIPWWDRPVEWLDTSVGSARALEVPKRILIVDNCSSSAPPAYEGVDVVRTPARGTVGVARNFGLEHVETELVVFLDADDRLLPGSLEYLVDLIVQHPEAAGVQGSQTIWYPDTGSESPDPWPSRWMRAAATRLQGHRRAYAFLFATRIFYPIHGALLRTQAVRDAGGFADWRQAQDWALAVSMALRAPLIQTRRLTYAYRRQSSIRTLHGELLAMRWRQRMAVRAKVRARLFEDAEASGWLRSPAARAVLWGIHHVHNALVEAYVVDACHWIERRTVGRRRER